jgi:hypothetical protein
MQALPVHPSPDARLLASAPCWSTNIFPLVSPKQYQSVGLRSGSVLMDASTAAVPSPTFVSVSGLVRYFIKSISRKADQGIKQSAGLS